MGLKLSTLGQDPPFCPQQMMILKFFTPEMKSFGTISSLGVWTLSKTGEKTGTFHGRADIKL